MSRPTQQTKSTQFRDNLRALIKDRGWTHREAADLLGIKYVLLRKYVNRGLANVTAENRQWLNAICREFKIDKIEILWSKKLHTQRPSPVEADAMADAAVWQLRILCHSHYGEPEVLRIQQLIVKAFAKLVLGEKAAAERARGGETIDSAPRRDRRRRYPRRME